MTTRTRSQPVLAPLLPGVPATEGGGWRTAVLRQPDWVRLLAVVALLSVIGLVMVLSASSAASVQSRGATWTFFVRHAVWLAVGWLALAGTARIDYRRWRRVAKLVLLVSIALLVAVLVPSIGRRVNGAQSWIDLGSSISLQPAELAKLALVLSLADLLGSGSRPPGDARLVLRPVALIVGTTVALVLLQPDLGTTTVIAAIALAIVFVAGVRLLPLGGAVGLAAAGAAALAMAEPYRRARLLAFLDPAGDPTNTGYQISQSLMGVSSGGVFGVGLGESWAKWGYLPNVNTDFIFAVIAEELGLVGALVVVALLVGFLVWGGRAALHAPDRFGTLVAAGVTSWVCIQSLVNIGGVIGILPITGLTLPFVSFGGSSLVVTMAATGILVNIARQGGRPALAAVPPLGR